MKYFDSKTQTSPKELRWYDTIISTDVELIHKLDLENLVLDTLSRREELIIPRLLMLVDGSLDKTEKNFR